MLLLLSLVAVLHFALENKTENLSKDALEKTGNCVNYAKLTRLTGVTTAGFNIDREVIICNTLRVCVIVEP